MASRNSTESGVQGGTPSTDLFIVSLQRKVFPAVCFGFTLEHAGVDNRGPETEKEKKGANLFVLLAVPSVSSHPPVTWCLALHVHGKLLCWVPASAFQVFSLAWHLNKVFCFPWWLSEIPDFSSNLKDCSQLCEQLLCLCWSDIKTWCHSLSTRSGICMGSTQQHW